MKLLHTVTAVIEAGTGMGLLACPSIVVTLLLGSPLDLPSAVVLGRVTGAALLALGMMCWLTRDDGQGRSTGGLVPAILFYNVMVAALLALAKLDTGLSGIALWPAIALHAVLAVWCVACLKRSYSSDS